LKTLTILALHPWSILRAAIPCILDAEILEPGSLNIALDYTTRLTCDLALVEPLAYPGAVRALAPQLPVVVFTTSTDPALVYRAVRDGASGFLHVSEPVSTMVKTLQAALTGTPGLSVANATGIIESLDATRQCFLNTPSPLTKRELETLELLAQGLTNAEIGERLTLTSHTIGNVVYRLFKALGVRNRVEATRWAVRAGLVDP